jgi:hypothetical protein
MISSLLSAGSERRAVHVESTCATVRDREALENLCLQRTSKFLRAKFLRALDAVLTRGLF